MIRRLFPVGMCVGLAVPVVGLLLIAPGGSALAAVIATLQAETMTSTAGYGATVVNDSTASGGQALLVDSNVSVQGSIGLTSPASTLTVRAHTDGSAASMTVSVDGAAFAATSVPAQTWASYTYTRALAAGTHTVRIAFTNACCRNLYLDSVTFDDGTGPSPTPTPTQGTTLTAYLTGYSYWDNDPPGTAIWPGFTHQTAGGTGTYADPITLAVGLDSTGAPDWPWGTKFYVPALRRYFVAEDSCAGCSGTRPVAGTSTWVDAWIDGSDTTQSTADDCANAITGAHTVIKDPASNYAVVPGRISSASGCTALYGESPVVG